MLSSFCRALISIVPSPHWCSAAAQGRSVPKWLVIRNCSDPQINGALRNRPGKQSLQAMLERL